MNMRFAAVAVGLAVCAVTPAFAQTASQKSTEENSASAGGSAGSIGPDKPKTTAAAKATAEAKQTAIDNHSTAHSAAGAGSQE